MAQFFLMTFIYIGLFCSSALATVAPSSATLIKSSEAVVVGGILQVRDLGQHVQEITVQTKEVLKDSNSQLKQEQTMTILYGYHGKGWTDFSKVSKEDYVFYLIRLAEHRRKGQPQRFKMVDSLFGFDFAEEWLTDVKKALVKLKAEPQK